ncbi:MAG: Ferric iron ABC transporter, permease protein [uncultured Nocardioidaceae bacterium]|uniref:Ferric iron ABC transporter, permease protein n=1 Tax=uncultured Nocardioidaceae bacterium TaxID=253824 RepID=A0A6J4L6R4_9ACTN|nr:MAG: Ferric iron ABC transporter, permease protein [uncultured Nocardioidaceae bacterium]
MTQAATAPTRSTVTSPRQRRRLRRPWWRSRWRSSSDRPFWSALALLVAAFVVLPVLAVVVDGLEATGSVRLPSGLAAMALTTLLLMGGVAVGTLVVGGGLAWLVTVTRFPLRDLFSWMLVLPLAMPAYILGFVFLSTFDEAGPVQGWLRDTVGQGLWLPPVRTLPGAVLVLTMTLFPYVYLMARAAFLEQSPSTYDAARTLGAGRGRALRSVVLPLARPSLAAGLALVMMEVLTDFATVQYFGVETVSVGVYKAWKGSYDFAAASQLSVLVLLFAVAVLTGERLLRGRARYTQRGSRGQGLEPVRLHGVRAAVAVVCCLVALGIGFLLPVVRLAGWAIGEARRSPGELVDPRFSGYLANSLTVAVVVALGCVVVALVLGHAGRMATGPLPHVAAQITTFGYAVPGAVVGIGVLLAFAGLDSLVRGVGVEGGTGLLVTGSVAGILYAYLVRFLAPAYQAIDASLTKVSRTTTLSALSLGAGPRRILWRVHLPLARSGVFVAFVLVLVDAIKELPLVLLLRPFGFSTLAVWVYELASENYWEKAALPALVIVAAAVVPVFLLFRHARLVDPHRPPAAGRGRGPA